MERFWEPVYDERDKLQWGRLANALRLRSSGTGFKIISNEVGIDQRMACALVSGRNLRPYLAQMYLNAEGLPRLGAGWSWILECTPKPTDMYPKAIAVPNEIRSYKDITEFLRQFPPLPAEDRVVQPLELDSRWVARHRPELFGFLLGFLVGDAGKSYPECGHRTRHFHKTAMTTNMAHTKSNFRLLAYVQFCLESIGIASRQVSSGKTTVRWNSRSSDIITWMLRVCLGIGPGMRTSRHKAEVSWMKCVPREFALSFIQGVAESDGSVDPGGRFVNIETKPNSDAFARILQELGAHPKVYKYGRQCCVRIISREARLLPIFNPLIRSYRLRRLNST